MPGTVDPYSHRTEVRWAHSWRRVVGVGALAVLGSIAGGVGGWLTVSATVESMQATARRAHLQGFADASQRAADDAAGVLARAEADEAVAREAYRVALELAEPAVSPAADPGMHVIAERAAAALRAEIHQAGEGLAVVPADGAWAVECLSGVSDLGAVSCAMERGTVSGFHAAAVLDTLGWRPERLARAERAAQLTALAQAGHPELAMSLRRAWERLGSDPERSLLAPEVLKAVADVPAPTAEVRALQRLVDERAREVLWAGRVLRGATRDAEQDARALAGLPAAPSTWAWWILGLGLLALALAGVLVRRRRGIVVVHQDCVRIDGRRVARADIVGVELDRGRLRIALHGGRSEVLDGEGEFEAVAQSLRRLLPTRDERRAEARGRVQAAVFQQAVEARSASE
ncbi:MAG: hypothetical protein ACI8PZ_000010 [Myxococcota bacterium]|jgi:hypothetical protein